MTAVVPLGYHFAWCNQHDQERGNCNGPLLRPDTGEDLALWVLGCCEDLDGGSQTPEQLDNAKTIVLSGQDSSGHELELLLRVEHAQALAAALVAVLESAA